MSERGEVGKSFRIDIGPLRARWKQIGFGFLWLCLMTISTAFMSRDLRFDCVRQLGQQARCVLTESPPLPRVVRYAPGAIGAINVVQKSRSKGGNYWDVLVLDFRGAEEDIAGYDSQGPAEALAARIRGFLANPRAQHFSFATSHRWQAFLYFAFGLGVFLVLSWHGFRDAGHLLVDIDRVHGELRVRRRLFGTSYGKQARYALSELRDIELEHGNVRNSFATRGQLPETGARLSVVRNSGHRFPLTPVFLPDPKLFETGLELVRVELGLASTKQAASKDSQEKEEEIPTPAPGHRLLTLGAAAKISQHARAWLLAVGVILVATAVSALVSWQEATSEGQLEIRAEYRCEFDGIEILPGGFMSSSLPPGRYLIRVFDAAVAGGWQAQEFQIRAGQSKLVVCRPR